MDIKEIQAKSILSKTQLKDADFDYSINPYTGCSFGCVYCYASFMGRFNGKSISDWGTFVYAKMNAPELLKKEIVKIPQKGKGTSLWFSSVTDPYQGVEAKYQLTRQCLQVLESYGFEGSIGILTKSNLVLRDIDIFKKLHHPDIGLTITSSDDKISRYFEKFAPPVSERLKALKKLHDEKIPTYAFIGPLLPHVLADDAALERLFVSVVETGNTEIYIEYLNLSPYILGRLRSELKDIDQKTMELFQLSKKQSFRTEWDRKIQTLVKKYNLHLRFGGTLYHPEME